MRQRRNGEPVRSGGVRVDRGRWVVIRCQRGKEKEEERGSE